MKKVLALLLLFVAAFCAQAAVKIGDTYEAVIAENGVPTGRMNAGDILLLRYADQTIKLKDGKVIALEVAKGSTVPAPAPRPKPTAKNPSRAAVSTVSAALPLTWGTNFMEALAKAKTENRHVFVFFTGSDWCGWCHRLTREILSTPDFQHYAGEKLVLVEIDFPRAKPQPPAVVEQNAKLAKHFRITGYPTIIVLDSDGRPVGEMGYQEGGPMPFLEKLRSF